MRHAADVVDAVLRGGGEGRVALDVLDGDSVDVRREVERAAEEIHTEGVPVRRCVADDLVDICDLKRGGPLCLPVHRLPDDGLGEESVDYQSDGRVHRWDVVELPVEYVRDGVECLEALRLEMGDVVWWHDKVELPPCRDAEWFVVLGVKLIGDEPGDLLTAQLPKQQNRAVVLLS